MRIAAPPPTGGASRSGQQWGLLNTGQAILGRPGVSAVDGDFTAAWDTTTGDPVEIAVVDTGADFSITDLAVNQGAGGHDWIDGDDDPAPAAPEVQYPSATSHGTRVAGIAAAALGVNQATGDITGGAPSARILGLRALGSDGSGWDSDIAAAFSWAADHGARVVNASLAGIGASTALAAAIAAHPDTLFVVAAGNGDAAGVGYDEDDLPASQRDYPCADPAPNVLCVAAVDNRGALATFSNYGAVSVDVVAPGVGVLSYVRGGGLQYWSGTSMATPFAAATALAFAAHPDVSPEQVRAAIIGTAQPLGALEGRVVSGGLLDAAAMLRALDATIAPTIRTPVTLPAVSPVVGTEITAGGDTFDAGTVSWTWQRCDAGGCADIHGAQLPAYTPTAADLGDRLRAIATAATPGGSTASTSPQSEPVISAPAITDTGTGGEPITSPPPSAGDARTPIPPSAAPTAPAGTPVASTALSLRAIRARGGRLRILGRISARYHGRITIAICAGRRCRNFSVTPAHGRFSRRVHLPAHARVTDRASVPATPGLAAAVVTRHVHG